MSRFAIKRSVLTGMVATVVLAALPAAALAQTVTRGPYLQMPGPDRMLVIWHTDLALTDPDVDYGTTVGLGSTTIGTSSADLMGGFKHEVPLSSLTDNTKYFYVIGSAAGDLVTVGADHAFTTSPLPGTVQPIRIWTFGDSGYWPGITHMGVPETFYEDNRQAYYDTVGGGDVNASADATDVMLYLGDNAYTFGNDATYQTVFFSPAPLQAWLRRQPFFSAAGNHEGFVNDTLTETGAYFDMFEFPTGNELGTNGVASGSESYYSFDYGNIHFVILDSEDYIENIGTTGAAMLTWLENDLIATSSDWIIAAWHRPPYSKGVAHDSDIEVNEIDMREIIVPVLEDHGVDLVLNGHSHTYERTPLIDGHYGLSDTLEIAHLLDGGDGDPLGEGAYRKASVGQGPHEGTVYIVTGAAADVRYFLPAEGHPLMVSKIETVGTSMIEVDGDVLTGSFIDDTGAVTDSFRIEKGTANCAAAPLTGCTAAGKAKLVLKDDGDDSKDKAKWKWLKSPITDGAADPLAGHNLRLCAWDGGGNALDLGAPDTTALGYATVGPVPTWEWDSPKAGLFLYKDKELSVDGLQKIKIKTGDKGVVTIGAKGAGVQPLAPPYALPVTTQMVNSDTGECWEAVLSAAKKNEAGKFVAVAP